MKKISDKIYQKLNNSFYDSDQIKWWGKDSPIHLMETLLNPVRVNYFKRKLEEMKIDISSKTALEVGCGGGIMSEAIAKMGFATTGIDPSARSLEIAKQHARAEGLSIDYYTGMGEDLPFANKSFDVIFCCDVLEHVQNVERVISEISRVLRTGGIFFYDTINRTLISKLVVIKIMQDWKYFSVLPDNLHVWDLFIRPAELKEILSNHGFQWKEHRGISMQGSIFTMLRNMHQRASGSLTCDEFSRRSRLIESSHLQVSFMGYALKLNI